MRDRHDGNARDLRPVERPQMREQVGGCFDQIALGREIERRCRSACAGYRPRSERQQRLAEPDLAGVAP
jgi:hypothetical protein